MGLQGEGLLDHGASGLLIGGTLWGFKCKRFLLKWTSAEWTLLSCEGMLGQSELGSVGMCMEEL